MNIDTEEELDERLGEFKRGDGMVHTVRVSNSVFYTDLTKYRIIILGATSYKQSPYPVIFYHPHHEDELIIKVTYTNCRDPKWYMKRATNAFLKMSPSESVKDADKKGEKTNTSVFGRNGVCKDCPSDRQVVETPQYLKDLIYEHYGVDHDPCPVRPETDAMKADWGRMNYVNPPFRHASGFMFKACEVAEKEGKESVFLVPIPFAHCWFVGVLDTGFVKNITLLRHGLKFVGYKKACPLDLALIHIGPGGVKKSGGLYSFKGFGRFDPQPFKRKTNTIEKYLKLA